MFPNFLLDFPPSVQLPLGVFLEFGWVCFAFLRFYNLNKATEWVGGLTNCKMRRRRLRAKVKCRVQSEDNPPEGPERKKGNLQSLDLKCAWGFHLKSVAWVVVQVDQGLPPLRLINMNTFSIDWDQLDQGEEMKGEREHRRHSNVFLLMRACGTGCVLLWVF